jgi:hypothetical protein
VLGGDFNMDLGSVCNTVSIIIKSMLDNDFIRCDLQFPTTMKRTYVNESLNHSSKIDFFCFSIICLYAASRFVIQIYIFLINFLSS